MRNDDSPTPAHVTGCVLLALIVVGAVLAAVYMICDGFVRLATS